eukprot:c9559_g1_i3.p1 GENE.c9559_g1_i3~~c9559_g1_i3.p1  ORF type:complete len:177 (-),score=30.51 c9559_g1_i3:111-641(-)
MADLVLCAAALNGDVSTIRDRLTANPAIKDNPIDRHKHTTMHFAAMENRIELLKFLCEFGCDVNCQSTGGWTPIHYAANCGHADVIQILYEHGADINAVSTSDGETALMRSVWGLSVDAFESLACLPGIDFWCRNKCGLNALDIAQQIGCSEISQIFAKVNIEFEFYLQIFLLVYE